MAGHEFALGSGEGGSDLSACVVFVFVFGFFWVFLVCLGFSLVFFFALLFIL